MLSSYITQLAGDEIQEFLAENESVNEQDLVLRQKEILGVPVAIVANQLRARKKARLKIPLWYRTKGIVYPPSINLEQASSQATANFKKNLVLSLLPSGRRNCGADLTGGSGVDSAFLAQAFSEFHYNEPNEELVQLCKHNHAILQLNGIVHYQSTAEEFLKNYSGILDFVYLDPSRRDEHARKVFKLSDCVPNITELQHYIFEKSDLILVKASPLLDIEQALRELTHVRSIYVLSVDNECKELLFLQDKKFTGEHTLEAFDLKPDGGEISSFGFIKSAEHQTKVKYSEPKRFIYEPNAAVIKAGAFKSIAQKFNVEKIATNTHLYTSESKVETFPGRIFQIEEFQLDEKSVAKHLSDRKVNVTTRNYPLTPEAIKKKYKLRDGGEKFLIGFSSEHKKHLVLASRLK